MFFYKGLSCPHCSRSFEESDDIVACPVCGAPHHRDCWTQGGGCACAAAHGTDEQWSRETATRPADEPQPAPREDTVRCPQCGTDNSPFAVQCSQCGTLLKADHHGAQPHVPYDAPPPSFHEYTPFHTQHMPCGGVSPEAVLEGESARDLAAVVRTNTPYYLPRFERMARTNAKASWNWAAFLIPSYWLLFRKQYLAGAAVLLLQVAHAVILQLLTLACFPSVFELNSYQAQMQELQWLLQTSERAELGAGIIFALMLTMFCVQLIVGLFGNRLYMKQCLRLVRTTRRAYPEGYHAQLAMVGGTSPALALVGYMGYQLLPSLILLLFV